MTTVDELCPLWPISRNEMLSLVPLRSLQKTRGAEAVSPETEMGSWAEERWEPQGGPGRDSQGFQCPWHKWLTQPVIPEENVQPLDIAVTFLWGKARLFNVFYMNFCLYLNIIVFKYKLNILEENLCHSSCNVLSRKYPAAPSLEV